MSAITFSADEIFTIAERIEKNGAKFYRKAAENLPAARETLLELAAMEDSHFATFSEMHKEISEEERETLGDPDGETPAYLAAMADGTVFDHGKDPCAQLKGKETLHEVLHMAIGLEKDSVILYLGMKDWVTRRQGKEKIDAIIHQEMGHIAFLSGRLEKA